MSEFSVNDHLEGILSDFEALKRSFEIDDVDDIPSAPSPIISPGSSHLLLNHNNKANETRGGGGMMMTGVPTSPASSAYGNINNNGNHSSMAYRSRLGLGVGPSPAQSPVLKSRTVGSLGTSLSFNRGTMGKPTFSNNGTGPSGGGVTRAASFQNRFNPNGYSSSSSMLSGGPGSDNDSLHSSSSSLEYSSSSGTMQPPLTKMGSFPSSPPPPSGEYHPHQYQQQQQHLLLAQQRAREMQPQGGGGGGVVLGGGNHVLKKFSSHGSVFHSELDDGPGLVLGGGGGGGGGHGSMPSLDLQSGEGGGGGGVRRASGAMSPGLRYGSAAWNGRSHSTAAATTGKESYYNSNSQNHVQPPSPHTPHTPQTPQKAKETPRLHKFPLDLDSLVGSPAGANKPQSGAPSPTPPRPPPRSHYPAGPPSASASPSASLSSLDSASDTTPPLSLHHPLSPLSSPFPPPPASPPGSTPVPEVSCSPVPLSPAQSPQLEQLCGPQAVAVAPGGGPKPAMRPAEDGQGEARESVGSILQRIASFSRPIVVADAGASPAAVAPPPRAPPAAVAPPPRASPAAVAPPPRAPPAAVAAVAPPPRALSNGVKRNAGPALQRQECVAPAETAPPPAPEQRLGKKMHEETAKVSETDTPTAMEEREAEPERAARGEGEEGGGGGGNERESNGQTPATQSAVDTATPVVATSSDQTTPSREKKEENSSEAKVEEEKKKKNDGVTNIEVEVEKEPVIPACRPAPTPGVGVLRGSELFGYVGIEAVLDQMRRKTMKAGFEFNIMVVGQSGLGKSTLVNTLFKSKVSRKSCTPNYEEKISKTVKLQSVSHMIEEKGVKMKLTVIDTPGFGDQINNENCWEPIEKYVNEQYEKYLREELHVNRKRRIPDSRIHCCVYFLPATGHWLRPIDIEFMKRLGKIVSIVPVIAKSDTLTIEERLEFKQRIRQDLVANGIRVYPQKEFDEDTEERMVNDRIRANIPFAVVGTDKEHQVNGNKVLGRKTKWGIIEVENVAHCEFANLRDLLIRSHLQDLKDVTHDIHYETYRVRRLNEGNMTLNGLALATRPLENGTAHNNKSDSESHL